MTLSLLYQNVNRNKMKFADFLNEKLNDAFATNVEIDVDYIDAYYKEDDDYVTASTYVKIK